MSVDRNFRSHVMVAGAILLAGAVWLVWQLGIAGGLPSGSGYRVHGVVPTAASLAANSRVTMAGAEVGRVEGVRLRGTTAIVELRVTDEDIGPLPADTRIAVRQHTPVGENYISLERGTSKTMLEDGGTLPVDQADEYVDLDQILSVLQGPTRTRARAMLQSTGGALRGRGRQLNATLKGTGELLEGAAGLSFDLQGQGQRIRRLIDQFGGLSRALGERGTAIKVLAQQGRVAMTTVAQRDEALRSTIRGLPATLEQVKTTSTDVATAMRRSGPVVAGLAAALTELQPAVRALRPAAQQGREVLRDLDAAAPPLRTLLGKLQAVSSPTGAAMPKVRKMFCELNPALDYIGRYHREIVGFMSAMGSAANHYDAVGHVIRITPLVTESALSGLPSDVSNAVDVLTRAGLLQKTRGLGWDPFPKPGAVVNPSNGVGVKGPADYRDKYTRIEAAC